VKAALKILCDVLVVLGIMVLLNIMAYNLTVVPSRPNVTIEH